MPKGAIALIQRGTCGFLLKWQNAEAAGAGAIVQINEGDPNRRPTTTASARCGSTSTAPA